MDIAIENLPPYESISCDPIREVAATLSSARAAQDEAKKALVEAEQTLPASQWRDAEAAESARAEGKPEPKTRSHTVAHEKRIANLEHEQRVAELALTRARGVVEAAIGEHGQAWTDELTTSIEALRGEWQRAMAELIGLHDRLRGTLKVARGVGIGDLPTFDALPFRRRQIQNADFASPQPNVPAYIPAGDVLAALATALVEPEPDAQGTPVPGAVPLARYRPESPNHSMGAVENEISERRAFMEQVQSPEGIDERERRVAERRARAEKNRQAGEKALEQTLAG